MGLEIERKFLLKEAYDFIFDYKPLAIVQGYISFEPVIRIRKSDDEYILTYKSKGLIARREYNIPIEKEEFQSLEKQIKSNIIKKKRYKIPFIDFLNKYQKEKHISTDYKSDAYKNLIVEVDIFEDTYKGLILAEIEFENMEVATVFNPPVFLGEEVSEDKRYQNVNMARK